MSGIVDRITRTFVAVSIGFVLIMGSAFVLKQTNVRGLSDLSERLWHTIVPSHGLIFVESPEVYTRQRLVNDRNEHEYWLRSEMARLDPEGLPKIAAKDLIEQARSTAYSITIRLPDDGASGSDTSEEPNSESLTIETPGVPYQAEFALKSAIRDKIRSMALENALDDRHDLEGNTVFGLKFDTAIVPGSQTRLRPTVVVKLDVDPFYSATLGRRVSPEEIVAMDLGAQFDADEEREIQVIYSNLTGYFRAWRTTIRERVYEVARTEKADTAKPDIGEALKDVLNVSVSPITATANDGKGNDICRAYSIGPPWSDYFQFESCGSATFEIRDVTNWLLKTTSAEAMVPFESHEVFSCARQSVCDTADSDFRILVIDQSSKQAVQDLILQAVRKVGTKGIIGPGSQNLCVIDAALSKFALDENEGLYRAEKLEHGEKYQQRSLAILPEDSVSKEDGHCMRLSATQVEANLGFYNFVHHIYHVQPYAYAAFPRGDVAGVVMDSEARATLGLALRAQADVDLATRERVTRAEPTIINFATNRPRSADSGGPPSYAFDFGWTVVKPGRMEPMQASQLVLVSVPAYLDELHMTVTTGWLDTDIHIPESMWSHSDRLTDKLLQQRRDTRIEIAIPPEYAAMDTLIGPSYWRQDPSFDDWGRSGNDPRYHVRSGEKAELVLRGKRLWRSAVVTLGGQPADKIRVLPDMQGLIVTFDEVGHPALTCEKGAEARADLVVWTSEGSDVQQGAVQISTPNLVSPSTIDRTEGPPTTRRTSISNTCKPKAATDTTSDGEDASFLDEVKAEEGNLPVQIPAGSD